MDGDELMDSDEDERIHGDEMIDRLPIIHRCQPLESGDEAAV